MDFSPTVLRNRGVPVPVYALADNGEPVVDADGVPVTTERHVRFTANSLADLEVAFASYTANDGTVHVGDDAIAKASEERRAGTMRRVFAIVWGLDEATVGRMLVTEQLLFYTAAVNTALALANGVDPTLAAEMVRLGIAAAEQQERQWATLVEAMATTASDGSASPGATGSEPGSAPAEPETSSGG